MAGSKSGPQGGHSRPSAASTRNARGTCQSFRRTFASVCIPAPARGTSLIKAPIDEATPPGTARQSLPELSGDKSLRRAAHCDAAVRPSCSHAAFASVGHAIKIEDGPHRVRAMRRTAKHRGSSPDRNMCVDPDMGSLVFGVERGRVVEHGKLLSRPPEGGGGIEQFLAIKVD